MIERRRSPRVNTNLEFLSGPHIMSPDSRITNLSSNGVFIKNDEPLPVNSEINLHIHLPDEHEIMSADARVVWNKTLNGESPAGIGLQFTNILPKQQEKLINFIQESIRQDMLDMEDTFYL